jgi:hypothetical protein
MESDLSHLTPDERAVIDELRSARPDLDLDLDRPGWIALVLEQARAVGAL